MKKQKYTITLVVSGDDNLKKCSRNNTLFDSLRSIFEDWGWELKDYRAVREK